MTNLSVGGFLSVFFCCCMSLNMVVVTKALHFASSRRSAAGFSPTVKSTSRRFSLKDQIDVDNLDHDLGCMGVGCGENSRQGSDGWRKFSFDEVEIPKQSYSPADLRTMEKVDLRPVASPLKPSPVEIVSVRGKQVYIKRDDLLRLERSNVSGNKARKMLALNQIPAEDFPKCVVSYGGSQSNAMLALAAVVQSKNAEATAFMNPDGYNGGGEYDEDISEEALEQLSNVLREKRFVYYTKKLPRFLKKNPSGNYFRAKTLGMEVIEVSNDEYNHLFGGDSGGKSDAPADLSIPVEGDSVWVSSVIQSSWCETFEQELLINSRRRSHKVVPVGLQFQGAGCWPVKFCCSGRKLEMDDPCRFLFQGELAPQLSFYIGSFERCRPAAIPPVEWILMLWSFLVLAMRDTLNGK